MIGSLRGTVTHKDDDSIIIDVAGVGYMVQIPLTLQEQLHVGHQAQVLTYLHVREQELTLFGFSDSEEKALFKTLLGIQGIGPKMALSILSHVSGETLRQAVARQEAALLTRVPGIGAKKAKQIVFQLKDKVGIEDIFETTVPITDADGEVIAALTALGYSIVEAQSAIQHLPKEAEGESVEEKVRLALSSLARF